MTATVLQPLLAPAAPLAATPSPDLFAPLLLPQRALLATLTIHEWRAHRRDREITTAIAKDHGARPGAGCYTKTLVPRQFLACIAKARTAARATHHRLTLPWYDDGVRILPVELHLTYTDRLRAHRQRFLEAVAAFLAAYEEAKAAARTTLGALYRETDYPASAALSGAFAMELRLQPFPAAQDWRVDLPATTLERLRQDLQTDLEGAHRLALADLHQRLAAVVARLADTLAEPDKIFRDSLVGNIRQLCRLLPALNLTRDPELAQLTATVERRLASLDPQTLRHNPESRDAAAHEAERILGTITKRLASYTGAA
jgi:hypothetical protein